MKIKWLLVGLCSVVPFWGCDASGTEEDFRVMATNALENTPILVSETFGMDLTNYIATVTNRESLIMAKMVLCERFLAKHYETMEEQYLNAALSVASNVCSLTIFETNTWYHCQARLLMVSCYSQSDNLAIAYKVASDTLSAIGTLDVSTDNPVSYALLKRNKVSDISIRNALVLSKALSAAMLKKRTEAINLGAYLPKKYQDMITRVLEN